MCLPAEGGGWLRSVLGFLCGLCLSFLKRTHTHTLLTLDMQAGKTECSAPHMVEISGENFFSVIPSHVRLKRGEMSNTSNGSNLSKKLQHTHTHGVPRHT